MTCIVLQRIVSFFQNVWGVTGNSIPHRYVAMQVITKGSIQWDFPGVLKYSKGSV